MSDKSQSLNRVTASHRLDTRQRTWCSKFRAVAISLWLLAGCTVAHAENRVIKDQAKSVSPGDSASSCLPTGNGFLKARLAGVINTELNWNDATTECTGATRPSGGVRLRFSHAFGEADKRLVLLFGIPALQEARDAQNLPVNITLIREGGGQFFGTRGDDKCMIETLTQAVIRGLPHKTRSYRVNGSGFCTQPARAIAGDGAVMIARFDFAGRVDFANEDTADDTALAKDH